MKISQGKNSKILVPLTIASIVIWGVIIYNIISYFTAAVDVDLQTDEKVSVVKAAGTDSTVDDEDLDTLEYKKLSRDPFLFHKAVSSQAVAKNDTPAKKENETPQINYQINGIVINSSSKLIVFADLTNNKTLFLREGETYNDITIKQINDNRIILVDRKKEKEIIINQ